MIVLVPWFGDTERFRPILDRWFASYAGAGMNMRDAVLLSDQPAAEAEATRRGCGACVVSIDGFRDLIRPGQPFDVKGALVCAYLLGWPYPTLVLDADAFLAQDPTKWLSPFADCPVAMPLDHGALMHDRAPDLDPPYGSVRKVCAGVQWFGAVPGRSRLVAGYRRAWEELNALPRLPWRPSLPHLLEQYAWSLASSRRGGRVLPVQFNWAPHFLGESPHAVVNHWFGFQKWSDLTPG